MPAHRAPSDNPQDVSPGARACAMALLEAQASRFPDLAIASPRAEHLEPREAALAHAICDAAIRRWLTLAHVLRRFVRQRFEDLEPAVVAALLSGSAQLLLMERIPAWAAINESVEWIKARRGRGSAGLVNAVLRRVAQLLTDERAPIDPGDCPRDAIWLDDGASRRLTDPVLPSDRWKRWSVQCSVPEAIIARWRGAFGDEATRSLLLHALMRPPVMLNIEHMPDDPGHVVRACDGLHAVPACDPPTLAEFLARHANVWVQDAASAEPVRMLRELSSIPRLVIDLCAGRGTKARQLAHMFPHARVVATEIDPDRFADLEALARRVENLRAEPMERVLPGGAGPAPLAGGADVLVVDVPCSNTGVLPRRAEARYRFSPRQVDRLVRTQREILERSLELLAPAGHVLYATCSLEPEENDRQVEWAVRHLGLRAVRARTIMPTGVPGGDPCAYRDGSFAALMTRA